MTTTFLRGVLVCLPLLHGHSHRTGSDRVREIAGREDSGIPPQDRVWCGGGRYLALLPASFFSWLALPGDSPEAPSALVLFAAAALSYY